MSSSNCCFLTCIQISQEAGQVAWYSHIFQNFPQLIVIHTVKGFGIVKKAEIDVFLELSCFFHDPADVGNLISGSYYVLALYKKFLLGSFLWNSLSQSQQLSALIAFNTCGANRYEKTKKDVRQRQEISKGVSLISHMWMTAYMLYSPWSLPGQNTGVGSFFPSPADLPNPGIEPESPVLLADSLPTNLSGKSHTCLLKIRLKYLQQVTETIRKIQNFTGG